MNPSMTNLFFYMLQIEIVLLPLVLFWWAKSELNQPLKPVWAEIRLTNVEDVSMGRPVGMEVSR